MNARLSLGTALLLTCVIGCGGGSKEPAEQSSGDAGSTPAAASATVDPATAATISGTINFDGVAPPETKINTSADPQCSQMHTQPMYSQEAEVHDGKLQWAFVYVKDGLGDMKFPTPTEPVVIDQIGCRYEPHVLGLMVKQPLKIVNSDETLHNIHAMPVNSKPFNIGMPLKGMEQTRSFDAAEVMVHVKCDVHSWMSSYIGVMTNPYYAVSAADGTFTIKGLPPGTYTIEAWHEKFGTQTQQITVGPSETKTADFTFKAMS